MNDPLGIRPLGDAFRAAYNFLLRGRRLRKLTEILLPIVPEAGHILDLGCGNGDLAAALQARRPGLVFTGVDVPSARVCKIPCTFYDGSKIPFPDASFDYVMLITVLHHTDDFRPILKEARRVARKGIILHDQKYSTRLDWLKLAIIDWPGNVPFGVYTPYNYKTRPEWLALYAELDLQERNFNDDIHFFGWFLNPILGQRLHFVSILDKPSP